MSKVLQSETTSFHYLSPRIKKIFKKIDIGLWGEKTFKRSEQITKIRGNFTLFVSKNVPLLFPKDYEYLESVDIGLRKVGAKRPSNGVNK